jgi:hypothetical protein
MSTREKMLDVFLPGHYYAPYSRLSSSRAYDFKPIEPKPTCRSRYESACGQSLCHGEVCMRFFIASLKLEKGRRSQGYLNRQDQNPWK